MGKKKNTKLASKANQKKNNLAEKTEQILLTMPRIIATQIGKDLVVQKQQENKLKLELKKWELQKKKLVEKMAALKKKNTSAAKKQMKTTQKSLQKTQQMISFYARNLELVKKQIHSLSQKKTKYNALQAQLMSFQKDWAKKMSATKRKKPKVRTKKSEKTAKSSSLAQGSTPKARFPEGEQIIEIIEIPAEEERGFAREEAMEDLS